MTKNEAVMLLEAARAEVARLTAELADQCLISATVMDERCEAVTRTVTAEAEAARLTKERAEVVLAVGGPYEGQTLAEACAVWRSAFRDAQAEVEHLKDVQRSDYSLLLDAWRDAGLPVPGADKQSVIQRVLVGILAEREAHAKTKAELERVAGEWDSRYNTPVWRSLERMYGETYPGRLVVAGDVLRWADTFIVARRGNRSDRAEAVLRGLRVWLDSAYAAESIPPRRATYDGVIAHLIALCREQGVSL